HAARNEVGVHPELDEFAPGPDSVVFAVAAAQLLERAGVLPEVGFVEQRGVVRILAAEQPVLDLANRCDAHGALALEIPGEIMPASAAERRGRHAVLPARPRVADRETRQDHAPDPGANARDGAARRQVRTK